MKQLEGEGCCECMALLQGKKGEESGSTAGEMDAGSVGGEFAAIVLGGCVLKEVLVR